MSAGAFVLSVLADEPKPFNGLSAGACWVIGGLVAFVLISVGSRTRN